MQVNIDVPKPTRPPQTSQAPLASQPVQLQLASATHSNQRLFSGYYLDHILPQEWHSLREEAEEVMARLRQLYKRFTPNPNNESQTEEDWIKPVLRELGHIFEVQAVMEAWKGIQRPDYIFYRDEAALVANKGKQLHAGDIQGRAYAIGDAKKWDCPLDQALRGAGKSGDPLSNKNPSYQIFFYMLHSGLPWGILTNGRLWRLYHAQTAYKLEVFYEVDLPALLEADVEAFLYFYTFFRRAAFEPGPLSLDTILAASTEKAQEISDNLRQQVYDALRYVAQGFLEYRGNHLEPSPETNKLIYDNSLILLYRLLFILYAEARDLLPMQDNKRYRRLYSLDAIKNEAVRQLHDELILPNSGMIWTRLQELFKAINQGSPPLTVTTFDGGLFDPQRHPFLEQYVVGDLSLCRAIDKLARVQGQFVDYRDLAERHLGTIYEGLLEYTLHVAEEPMVELKTTSMIVPAEGVAEKLVARRFEPGEVYLVTDRGERKLTGSYYTPDYIVKYMVDEAVKPILDEACERAQSDEERIQAILSINVLDPSMGSGHFPVEVTEYIARYLVEKGLQPEESGEVGAAGKPQPFGKAGGKKDEKEADLTYWKRRVAQQCIYGVDLNPLAVELAKLSLWLITAAKDRPLSFLDHHLRAGNALVGSWLAEVAAGQHPGAAQEQKRAQQSAQVAKEAGQLYFFFDEDFRQTTREALDAIAAIEHNPGATLTDVKAQEAAYETLRQHFSDKYRHLANLGTALYYDLEVSKELWRPLADYALGRAVEHPDLLQFDTYLDAATALARAKGYFHWELEFPNIFFGSQGQALGDRAGFDVVIGNPPYVRQEQLGPDKPFFQDRYEVYHGVADLFVYFFAQGLRLLRKGGRLAYISSNSWLRANYATPLRQYLRTKTTVETIVDLGDNRVFADAPDLTPAIQIVRKTMPVDRQTAQAAVFGRGENITSFRDQLDTKLFAFSVYDQSDEGWQLSSAESRMLFNKLMSKGRSLGEIIQGRAYLGIKTGLNEAFIIEQTTRDRLVKDDASCAAILKPMLRGEDLRPWYQENEGLWLICLPTGWTMQTFPDLQQDDEDAAWKKLGAKHPGLVTHLEPFADAARKRQDRGQFWWELRPCDYYDAFEKPKIFWAPIGKYPRYSWDEKGQFINNSAFFLLPTDISLLGILQSRISWFCTSQLCTPLGERAGLIRYQQFIQYVVRLPIPTLTYEQRERIGGLAQDLTETARQRYEARRRTTHRIVNDLGTPAGRLNQRLLEWWLLSFKEFREELARAFKRDIPLKERDDWEALLRERRQEIGMLTEELVRLETALNEAVYDAFGLDEAERRLIERETKYACGEW
jgi:type I restriction-modification system DNA methylase subunit